MADLHLRGRDCHNDGNDTSYPYHTIANTAPILTTPPSLRLYACLNREVDMATNKQHDVIDRFFYQCYLKYFSIAEKELSVDFIVAIKYIWMCKDFQLYTYSGTDSGSFLLLLNSQDNGPGHYSDIIENGSDDIANHSPTTCSTATNQSEFVLQADWSEAMGSEHGSELSVQLLFEYLQEIVILIKRK